MILAGNGRHAALQQAGRGKRARKIARVEGADHTRQRVKRLGIKRVLDGGDTLGLKRLNCFSDFGAKFDPAYALVAPLDAGGLALNFDLEPAAADAGWLHRQAAGLTGNASVSLVAADHCIQRAMTADFLIDHDIDEDVALELDASGLKEFDGEDVACDTTFHIAGSATIDASILDLGRPRIVAPAFAFAYRNDVGVPVQQKRAATARTFPCGDDIWAAFVTLLDRYVAGMFLQFLPV